VKTIIKIFISLGLLALTLWLGNLAAYNTWASFLAHNKNPVSEGIYAYRSNVFFVLTLIFFVTFLVFNIWNLVAFIRQRRKQSSG
jgi:hypothetical protein